MTLTHADRQTIRQARHEHRLAELGIVPDGLKHGVEKTYQGGCRCDECRRAARLARRRARAARKADT